MWFPALPQRTANQEARRGLLPPSPLFWPWPHLKRSLHEGLWQGAQDATGEAKLDSSTSSQNCHLGTLARGSGGTPGKEFILVEGTESGRTSQVLVVKNLPANAGDERDMGLIPGLGRSAGVRNGNPLRYSCLENPMDRGAWSATVHGVTKSRTRLK